MTPIEQIIAEFREKFVWIDVEVGKEKRIERMRAIDENEALRIEAWLTTTLEEVYKAGMKEQFKYDSGMDDAFEELEKKIKEKSFKEGEKNGLSRAVEAVKGMKTCAVYGYDEARCIKGKEEIIEAIESLN